MASTMLLHPIPPTISPRISGVRVQTCPFICSLRRTSVGVIRLRGSEAARQQWRSTRRRGTSVRCGAAKFIGQSEFGSEVLESDLPVLVDFVADWCGPCKLIAPSIDWASQEYEGRIKVVKIDHDANPELIAKYKVYGLPCLIVFKNGKDIPESRREGAITKAKLKAYLDSLLD